MIDIVLYGMCRIMKIHFHALVFLFLIVSFAVEKLLSFMRIHLLVVDLNPCVNGSFSELLQRSTNS